LRKWTEQSEENQNQGKDAVLQVVEIIAEKGAPVHFYRVLRRDKHQTELWLKKIRQSKGDPDWNINSPTSAVLCSAHFVTGKVSNMSGHPDYVPSIFEDPSITPSSIKDVQRFERFLKHQTFETSRQTLKKGGNSVKIKENKPPAWIQCCVPACQRQVLFDQSYGIPSDLETQNHWSKILNLSVQQMEEKKVRACWKHFQDEHFQIGFVGLKCEKQRILKKGVVPSLYLEAQDPLQDNSQQMLETKLNIHEVDDQSSSTLFEDPMKGDPEAEFEVDSLEPHPKLEIHDDQSSFPLFEDPMEEDPEAEIELEPQGNDLRLEIHDEVQRSEIKKKCSKCKKHEKTIQELKDENQEQKKTIEELKKEVYNLKVTLSKII
jgi:hypothetical protein